MTSTPLSMTARSPEDVLAIVPVVLGFVPTDSVAMLTFDGADTFHARVDLPTSPDDVTELVDLLVQPCLRHGVRRVVLVLYSKDAAVAGRSWVALERGCRAAGIQVAAALRADGERWFPLLVADHDARVGADLNADLEAAAIGVPYDVSSHPFLARSVVEGRVTLGSRDELVATLRRDPVRVAAITALLVQRDLGGLGDLLTEGRWVEELVTRHARGHSCPSDEEAARLLRAIQVVPLRDAAWSVITRADAVDHVQLWTDALRRTPAELLAPPAALLGWAAWQAGHGALAWCALDVCSTADPDYTLMTYLAHILTHAVSPSMWTGRFDWTEGLCPPHAS